MGVYLRATFEASNIILTSFRQGRRGGGGNFTPTPPQNEPLSPPRLGLIYLIIVRFQHGKHTLNETFF